MKLSYVYIITNKNRTVFYIGVTSNLDCRIAQHKAGTGSRFCSQYKVRILIYYETFSSIIEAIRREKQLKKWNRAWKIELIKSKNHDMKELM